MDLIREKLRNLPDKPGVYLMKNSQQKIIYVGKAKVLKNRVRSYFNSQAGQILKTKILVEQIADFDYLVTGSELEALILECTLIKRHAPRYNVLLKDDKTYPYIKITVQEAYPRVFITRKYEQDGSMYFGPFADVQAVRNTLELLKQTFKLRTCKTMARHRPCLRYYIKECAAPCQGYISPELYGEQIANVRLFLEGRSDKLIAVIKQQIKVCVEKLQFEQAIIHRQQLEAIGRVQQEQRVIAKTDVDMDIVGLADGKKLSCVQLLPVRGGKLVGQSYFFLKNTGANASEDNLNDFLKQYYAQATFIPREIIVGSNTLDGELLGEWLSLRSEKKVKIISPSRGQKKELLDMARENAGIKLTEVLAREEQAVQGDKAALKDLANALEIARELNRIECFDISHNQGQQTVASMVVFVDGRPCRQEYKRYKLHTTEGRPDDFLSMQEVIARRYRNGENIPDLLVIDGGKGQLSSVCQVLEEMGLSGHVPVISLAKQFEEIFLPGQSKPMVLDKHNPSLHILQNIRNEAHRFAITYHRKLRDKKNISSVLEHIEGIGPAKRTALLKHFKSISGIKQATLDELQQVAEVHEALAVRIYEFFHGER